jgi:hypothetical protein
MQVVLVMFRNDGERRSFSVVRNMTVIGRREDCDLRIPVGDVSRKHCRLVRTDDGIRIEDLGSSNGTYVNGERIQESELNAGDTVGVGPVQFIIQIDGEPDEDDMSPPVAAAPPQPIAEEEPQDELLTEEDALEEVPAENEFQIEHEHTAVSETPLEEEPLEELEPAAELTEEEPLAEAPLEELEELPLEEAPLEEAPLEEEPAAEVVAEPAAAEDDLEFELEEEPLAEAEGGEHSTAPAADPVGELELDELELEEADHRAAAPAPHTPAKPADALDELEFDESELELDEAAPATEAPATAEEESLELAPAPPAYTEVDIDASGETSGEGTDELDLEKPHPANGQPAETASESSWDFVIEETDSAHSHHDFKLDLDSPHEQPHGS